MGRIKNIIIEEILNTAANYPEFGQRLDSITEVGEASASSYPFTIDEISFDEVNYNFDTEEDDYIVVIELVDMHSGVWEMQFGVAGGTPTDVVDRGRMYKVMSTITQIGYDFINRYKPNVLRFKPVKDDEKGDDKRRYNLYMAYVRKNLIRDYFAYEYGDYIVIERKVKIKSNIPKV